MDLEKEMNIRIKVKSVATMKEFFSYEKFITDATNVKDLIFEVVKYNVTRFNDSRNNSELLLVSSETIESLSRIGKVSFNGKPYNTRKVDVREMQDEAVFQFINQRFKIVNETKKKEYRNIEDSLELEENNCLVFIKLAMLVGRRF
jgi:hypothetical protein